jgi:hypothetical protein
MRELIRAINGTLQTRVPRLSIDDNEVVKNTDECKKKEILELFLESIGLCFGLCRKFF